VPKATSSLIIHAFLLSLFIFALFILWFAVLDPQDIFLYGHLGYAGLADFNLSRHWMTGLVTGGLVLVFYIAA
jgi:hypothetical protein